MTAVLVATAPSSDGGPAAALAWDGEPLLARLLGQLQDLGVHRTHVITRPQWADALRDIAGERAEVAATADGAGDLRAIAQLARAGQDPLVLAHGEVATQREALAGLLADPRIATGVLHGNEPAAVPLRLERGRVVSAGSGFHAVHRPTRGFLSVLRVAPGDRLALAEGAEALAAIDLPADDVVALSLVGLVRSGVRVGGVSLRELFWSRPRSPGDVERARRDIEGHDEDRALLDSAVKADDGFFTTFFVSPYSRFIARWAAHRGLTPNQVTLASFAVALVAAAAMATGERWGLVAGALGLQAAFTLDCVDGQLARYSRQFSKLGAWLDAILDRAKEYAIYAGLAIGASRAGDPVWVLAGAALTLQTVRHSIDFSWGTAQHEVIATVRQPPLHEAEDAALQAAGGTAPAPPTPSRWRRLDHGPGKWVKKAIAFPIGERFAAISLTAALWDARTTFTVVLAWGGFALLYGSAGRLLRSIR